MANVTATLSRKKSRGEVDMTTGNTLRHLLTFALPLLLGNLFQLLYNTVDAWVVGNFVSNEAFSAVGIVAPIINVLIGLFTGLSSGAGAVISQYFGAKKNEQVSRAVHTSLLLTFLLGIVFTVVGIGMTPLMLTWMGTKGFVRSEAITYLTIYFAGVMALMIYNIGSGILRAVGDSNRPFLFLVISAVINTALDLLFVLKFKMGVAGVAWATVIAEVISAILVVIVLLRSSTCIRLSFRRLRMDPTMLRQIVRIGLPSSLQMSITAFSNVFVLSYINFFGENCSSGWVAYNKLDQFILLPMQSLSMAATTFVGQNLGCGQGKRARRGADIALLSAALFTALLNIPLLLFAPELVAFFNSKPEVVAYGADFLYWLSPFYVLFCVFNIYAGALRGAGNSRIPMVIMLATMVGFRQLYLYVVSTFIVNDVIALAMGFPVGWFLCSAILAVYFRFARLERTRVLSDAPPAEAQE